MQQNGLNLKNGRYVWNHLNKWEKCKISPCGLPDLQIAPCGFKMNLEVLEVC